MMLETGNFQLSNFSIYLGIAIFDIYRWGPAGNDQG
jgi:hypothetical protein